MNNKKLEKEIKTCAQCISTQKINIELEKLDRHLKLPKKH